MPCRCGPGVVPGDPPRCWRSSRRPLFVLRLGGLAWPRARSARESCGKSAIDERFDAPEDCALERCRQDDFRPTTLLLHRLGHLDLVGEKLPESLENPARHPAGNQPSQDSEGQVEQSRHRRHRARCASQTCLVALRWRCPPDLGPALRELFEGVWAYWTASKPMYRSQVPGAASMFRA